MSTAALLEILIIIGIIATQVWIFGKNRRKILQLANVYPKPEQLSVEEYVLDYETQDNTEGSESEEQIRYYENLSEAIDAGEPFIYAENHLHIHRVKEIEDGFRTIEVEIFNDENDDYDINGYRTKKAQLISLFSSEKVMFIYDVRFNEVNTDESLDTEAEEYATVDLIESKNTSLEFAEIIADTNEYLQNNKGAAADFNILKDISERYSEALDNEVQSDIATPLYIGLLGTFLGVSFGLVSLLFSGESEPVTPAESGASFITDAGIRSFLIGVAIAMAGSFCGLLFTLWGNRLLKEARSNRDKLKNSYYTFLQKRLLPKLNSDMAASLGNLKSVLDSFNHDFLEKVANFQPIISSLTDNIKIQKDFIVKLDEIGFTKMANASVTVFEKVKESERLFENFLGYQVSLNKTLETGAEMTDKIKSVLSRMTKLEEGFALVPGYLEKHDESIMRQVHFFERHKVELDAIANKVEQNLDEDADRLKELMDNRLTVLERDAQNAYERWQEHFKKLNEDNLYQKILDYMQPFSSLNEQQAALNSQQDILANAININNEKLVKKFEKDADLQKLIAKHLEATNKLLAEATKRNRVQIMMDKMFGVPANGSLNGQA